jgi:hypothetical protein
VRLRGLPGELPERRGTQMQLFAARWRPARPGAGARWRLQRRLHRRPGRRDPGRGRRARGARPGPSRTIAQPSGA